MNTVFLPEDYIAPVSNGSYMKLEDGINKIRILSCPELGWEDWKDKKPVRFRMDEKPERWVDPKNPGKHFWMVIIWNYKNKSIQILKITQVSIRKAIEALIKDSDWGMPFFYDIKITRNGESYNTYYDVNPSPHKPIDPDIQKAFDETPCNLEALFDGNDPFGLWENYTKGVFEEEKHEKKDFDFSNSEMKKEVKTISVFDGKNRASEEEMESFVEAWAQTYDKNLLISYIENRSKNFHLDPEETVHLLMKNQDSFEKEFKNWAEMVKSG